MGAEDYVKKEEDELKEIKDDPLKFICRWAEDILPFTGRKIFEVVSLMTPSLLLPDMTIEGQRVKTHISVLLLASPGAGKSSTAKALTYFGINPISIRESSQAKLEDKIEKSPMFTLIMEDFASMSKDPFMVKVVEGVIGEEKRIQRATMRKDLDLQVEACGIFAGVPNDLANYLTSGYLFRIIPLIIYHNEEEHSSIGERIMKGVKVVDNDGKRMDIIKNYYLELKKIQDGKHKIEPIKYFDIPEVYRTEAFELWDKATKRINQNLGVQLNWFRSLHEFLRMMISHAFLNVFNRKVENNTLFIEKEDFDFALRLMKKEIQTKYDVLRMDVFSQSILSMKELKRVMVSEKISSAQKNVLKSLIKDRKLKDR
jgi:hypothetical protein